MAGGVYSERFIGAPADGNYHTYTVPPGKRAVIKFVSAFNNPASSTFVSLWLANTIVWGVSVPGASGVFAGGLGLVLYEGEVLRMSMGASTSGGMSCCGYLLAM